MPISEKIIKEIDETDAEDKLKDLMKDILRLEDDGAKRWTRQYEAKIKDYLGFEEEGES